MEKLKRKIKEIEAEIFAITGKSNKRYNHWADDDDKRNRVIELLDHRQIIMDEDLFAQSDDEIERLENVNNKLIELTNSTRKKLEQIVLKTLNERQDEEEFVIEGSFNQVYNGEESVLKLDEDSLYGSNFTLIIKVLTELYAALQKPEIVVFKIDSTRFSNDDKDDYPKRLSRIMKSLCAPLRKTGDYPYVYICYAAQNLVYDKLYSGADLIRLNDFKQEITVKHRYSHQQSADPDLRS